MKLSIVIVSYNVKYYLEQCLCSVIRACYGLDAEIWVVDNASSDGSVEYIRSRFPDVHFIENQENVGFSRANNMAIRQATGEYILLLNPDTVVGENTLSGCLHFMDTHTEAGARGCYVEGRRWFCLGISSGVAYSFYVFLQNDRFVCIVSSFAAFGTLLHEIFG